MGSFLKPPVLLPLDEAKVEEKMKPVREAVQFIENARLPLRTQESDKVLFLFPRQEVGKLDELLKFYEEHQQAAAAARKARPYGEQKTDIEFHTRAAQAYFDAMERQYIWTVIHGSSESLTVKAAELVRHYPPEQVERVISNDPLLTVEQKMALFSDLKGLADAKAVLPSGMKVRVLFARAYQEQKEWMSMHSNLALVPVKENLNFKQKKEKKGAEKTVPATAQNPASDLKITEFTLSPLSRYDHAGRMPLPPDSSSVLSHAPEYNLDVNRALSDEWVQTFMNEWGVSREEAKTFLQENRADIQTDIAYWLNKQGQRWKISYTRQNGKPGTITMDGPSRDATSEEIATITLLCYLVQDRLGPDARAIEAFIATESNYVSDARGFTRTRHGYVSNGNGLMQPTSIGAADYLRFQKQKGRREQLDDAVKSFGKPALPETLGKTEKGQDILKPYPSTARNVAAFKEYMENPGHGIAAGVCIAILKGLEPHCTLEELADVAFDYNGNRAIDRKTGDQMRYRYSKKVPGYAREQKKDIAMEARRHKKQE